MAAACRAETTFTIYKASLPTGRPSAAGPHRGRARQLARADPSICADGRAPDADRLRRAYLVDSRGCGWLRWFLEDRDPAVAAGGARRAALSVALRALWRGAVRAFVMS
jgi:hypothetical protein